MSRLSTLISRFLFLFLGRGRTFKLVLWGVMGVLLGALSFAYISAGEIYEYQDTVDGVHLPPVDAVVVLAGGRGRIAAAGDTWYRYWEISQVPLRGAGRSPEPGKTPILYVSGMGPKSTWSTLGRQLRRGVFEVIQPENVVLETESTNTEENAIWLRRHAEQQGWRRVLLMTSPYHMRRSRYIFEQVLARSQFQVQIETLSIFQEPFDPEDWRTGLHGIRVTLTEYLKWIYYRALWKAA